MAVEPLTERQTEIVRELQAQRDTLTEEQRNVLARYEARMPKETTIQETEGLVGPMGSLFAAPTAAVQAVGEFAKPAVLPTVGSLVGRAAGSAFPVLGPVTPMVGSGLGSGAGEAVNQLTGITEPSMGQLAMATGLPMAVEGLSNLYRTGRMLGAAKGPETLNKLAYPAAQGKVAGLTSTQASGPLFEQAAQQGVTVPVEKTWKLINSVANNPNISKVEKQAFVKVLKESGLSEFLTKDAAGLNPAKLQRVLNATGELIPSAEGYGGGHLKRLFGALSQDLDDAANSVHAAATLKEARQLFKREQVLKDIGDELSKAFTLNRGQEARQFNANKIVRTLEDQRGHIGKFFQQAFSPAEQKDLVGFFEFLNTIPVLKPGAGAQYGSGRVLARSASAMGMGGGTGFAMSGGDPVMAAAGTAAGAAVPAIDDMVRTGIQVWKMPGGKSLLRNVLNNSDGVLTPQVLSTIAAFATAKTAAPPPEVSQAGTLRPLPTAR